MNCEMYIDLWAPGLPVVACVLSVVHVRACRTQDTFQVDCVVLDARETMREPFTVHVSKSWDVAECVSCASLLCAGHLPGGLSGPGRRQRLFLVYEIVLSMPHMLTPPRRTPSRWTM